MLQHSRTGTGQKEDIDINTLIEEYVGLITMACVRRIKVSMWIKSKLDPNAGIENHSPEMGVF
jgi:hypothetical protein